MTGAGASLSLGDLARGPRAWILLAAFCLAAFLPGFFVLPPLDRDEARFAQASRQMVETGDLVDIRFQETARHKKPVGIYWLQAASARLLAAPGADPIWAYRVPSLAGALCAVLLTFALGRAAFGAPAGLAAAFLLATALVLGVEARLAKTDAVLLATLMISQLALGRIYLDGRAGRPPPDWAPWVFWLGQGLGILVKGPVVPMISGLTALALVWADRRDPDRVRWWRSLKPWPAAILTILIVAPWLVAINLATHGGFLRESVGGDLVPKLLSGEESHGAPPGYYLVLFTLTFWPGSLLALLAVPWAWARRMEPAVRFCLAWIVPAWIVFEAVPTKLPHYTLPTYPAIALLAAAALVGGGAHLGGIWRRVAAGWFFLVTLALGAGIGLFGTLIDGAPDPLGIAAGVLAWGLGAAAIVLLAQGARGRLVATLAVLGILVQGLALQGVLPASQRFWLSRAAAEAVAEAGLAGKGPVASAGYTEPSLVFALGTGTRLVTGKEAADLLADGSVVAALVESDHLEAFTARAERRGLVLAPPVMVEGFNYSRGKETTLALFRGAAP